MKPGSDIVGLARPHILSLAPYSSARDEFQGQAGIFLDANENPYPGGPNRYPDPHQSELKAVISGLKSAPIDNIFLGNGSDEAIDLLIRIFCEPGIDQVIIPSPTYGMYAVCAGINNIKVIDVPLDSNFDLDVNQILGKANDKTKLVFLCSPNNPTGNLLNRSSILQLLEKFRGLVVVDEAYIDFADSESWLTQLSAFSNLVVLQTLSKSWGLAGLRVGMCFANPSVIQLMNKTKPPYNISELSQQYALKKLRESASLQAQQTERMVESRRVLNSKLLKNNQVVHTYPSDANFILVKMQDPKRVYAHLIRHGIVVRDRSETPGCEGCLRISVGTEEEIDQLIDVLENI